MRLPFKKKKTQDESRHNKASNQRVYSYYTASKRQIESFERGNQEDRNYKAKRPNIKTAAYYLAAILGLFIFILMIGLTNRPNISVAEGPAYRDTSEYEEKIAVLLKSSLLNYTKITLEKSALEAQIIEEFPEIEEVKVSSPLIGWRPNIEIINNDPFAVILQPNSDSFILDNSGKAVININNTTIDTAILSTISNQSGFGYSLADQVFKPTEMKSLNSLHYQLQTDSDSQILSYILPITPREIHLQRGGYFVKFSLDNSSGADTKQQFGALKSIENSISQQRAGEPSEYIDVRLGDKVYVK